MEERVTRRSIQVGLFVTIGLLVLAAGILMIGNLHETFKRKFKVVSFFDDVSGLQVGNNVWFSGVKVGTVSGLRFRTSSVEVMIKVDQNAQQFIRKDSRVKIGTDGLIGNKILIIHGGTARVREAHDGDTLRAESSVSQESLLATLQESNESIKEITANVKLLTEDLIQQRGTIGRLIREPALYEHLLSSSQLFESTMNQTRNVVDKLNRYSDGLSRHGTPANEIMTDTVIFKEIRQSSVRLSRVLDTVSSVVRKIDAKLNSESAAGVLLNDTTQGKTIKRILKNLDEGSKTLTEDLTAAQESWPLRRYFRKKKSGQKP